MDENKKKIFLGLMVFVLIIIVTLVIITFTIYTKAKTEQEEVDVKNSSNQTKDVLEETKKNDEEVNTNEEDKKDKEKESNKIEGNSKEALEAAQKAEKEAREEKAKAEAKVAEAKKKADELAESIKRKEEERNTNMKSYVVRTEAGQIIEEYSNTGRVYFAFWLSSTNNIDKIKITFHEELGEVVEIEENDLRGHYSSPKAYKEMSKNQIRLENEFQYRYSGDIAYVTIVITYNNGETRSNNFYYADNAVG